MQLLTNVFGTTLGRKVIMAMTGMGLFLFVVGHLVGNLQIFLGPEAINKYGHFLQSNPEIIWPARLGLIAFVLLHIFVAIKLSAENKAARPVGYVGRPSPVAASYASRTMLMSGLIIAAFVVYHLLHFTVQVEPINFTGTDFHTLVDAEGRHDIFRMMVLGFSRGWVTLFYVIAIGLLCLHLSHGLSAMFSSLGWKNASWAPVLEKFAVVTAWLIFLGYISIPVAVFLGFGKS